MGLIGTAILIVSAILIQIFHNMYVRYILITMIGISNFNFMFVMLTVYELVPQKTISLVVATMMASDVFCQQTTPPMLVYFVWDNWNAWVWIYIGVFQCSAFFLILFIPDSPLLNIEA